MCRLCWAAAARNNRALARMKLQDWAGAEEDASLVIKEEPKNVKVRHSLLWSGGTDADRCSYIDIDV